MDHEKFDETVSDSREESIRKALELIGAEEPTRKIERPHPNLKRIFFVFFAYLVGLAAIFAAMYAASRHFGFSVLYVVIAIVLLAAVSVAVNAKKLVINSVLIYQRFAPEKMRASCLFTPSCSEYMLLAVEKYGVIKGVGKGIKRIRRCHRPNGGVDYP